MTASSHEWDAVGAGSPTAGDRLQRWSVVATGVGLAALPLVGVTGADQFFGHPGSPRTWQPY